MKKEEPFVLVPATYRERKTWWNEKPRTLEQVEADEKAAVEHKKLEEERKAAEEAAFQLSKQTAEQEFYEQQQSDQLPL
jgi:hypothetical protein